MAKFKGGIEEAARMLQGLGGDQARKLLEQIRMQDPQMAQKLEENLVRMEDLQYSSAAQLVGLLRDISLEEFGLALRTVDKNVVDKLLGMVSTGIRLDIEDGLKGPPRKVSEVQAAQSKILEVARKKSEQGLLTLSPESDEIV
jgi:flagellar motor switch protein FliG